MANRAGAQELRIVVEQDPLFGPVIMLGEGGVEWQADRHAAVALPPLNMTLARYLVIQAIKSGKIRGRSALRPLDIAALSRAGASLQPGGGLPGNRAARYPSSAGRR